MNGASRALLAGAVCLLSACVARHGPPHSAAASLAGWREALVEVPFYPDRGDQCGPSVLAGVLNHWGAAVSPDLVKKEIYRSGLHGSLSIDLLLAARARGMRAEMSAGTFDGVKRELDAGHPLIAFVNLGLRAIPVGHFMVLTGYDDARQVVYAHSGPKRNHPLPYKKFNSIWDKAENWMLLVLPPETAAGWVALGNSAFNEGRLAEAESAYRSALKLEARHPAASNNLAMAALRRGGDLAEAEALARDALERAGPLRPIVLDTLANVYLRQRRFAEARALVAQAEAAAPKDGGVVISQLLVTRGNIESAANEGRGAGGP